MIDVDKPAHSETVLPSHTITEKTLIKKFHFLDVSDNYFKWLLCSLERTDMLVTGLAMRKILLLHLAILFLIFGKLSPNFLYFSTCLSENIIS